MKLFYTPVERMLLAINDEWVVIDDKFLWDTAWNVWLQLDDKGSRLTRREERLMHHCEKLLQI